MWRYLLAGLALVSLIGAGWLMFHGEARSDAAVRRAEAPAALPTSGVQDDTSPPTLPEAPERSREQKRFDRYDKDRNATITREEYLVSRRKAFAKLDTNGDGRLSFEEWGAKTLTKFATADGDKSGAMDRTEFATTAVKRKAKARPKCVCPAMVDDND